MLICTVNPSAVAVVLPNVGVCAGPKVSPVSLKVNPSSSIAFVSAGTILLTQTGTLSKYLKFPILYGVSTI